MSAFQAFVVSVYLVRGLTALHSHGSTCANPPGLMPEVGYQAGAWEPVEAGAWRPVEPVENTSLGTR